MCRYLHETDEWEIETDRGDIIRTRHIINAAGNPVLLYMTVQNRTARTALHYSASRAVRSVYSTEYFELVFSASLVFNVQASSPAKWAAWRASTCRSCRSTTSTW